MGHGGVGLHLQFYASSVKPGRQRRRQVGFVVMSLATQVQVAGLRVVPGRQSLLQVGTGTHLQF